MTLQETRAVSLVAATVETDLDAGAGAARPSLRTTRSRGWRTALTSPTLLVSALGLALIVAWAVQPDWFAAADPYQTNAAHKLQAPSIGSWFGTDSLGRDQFSRLVHGTRTTLTASLLALVIGFGVSSVLGVLAGYLGGWVDEVIGRFVDVFLAVPGLLVSLMIVTALGFGTVNIAIAVGIGSVAAFTRVLRAEVLRVRQSDFVAAARLAGLRWPRILTTHIFPHSVGPIITLLALQFGEALLSISALSFLGFGVQPPEPEWGSLVSDGRTYLSSAWWLALLPGLVIVASVLAANRVSKFVEKVR